MDLECYKGQTFKTPIRKPFADDNDDEEEDHSSEDVVNGNLDFNFKQISYEHIREKLPNVQMMRDCLEDHLDLYIPPKSDFTY